MNLTLFERFFLLVLATMALFVLFMERRKGRHLPKHALPPSPRYRLTNRLNVPERQPDDVLPTVACPEGCE